VRSGWARPEGAVEPFALGSAYSNGRSQTYKRYALEDQTNEAHAVLPARGPAQLDEATDGPLTFELLGPVQLPDFSFGGRQASTRYGCGAVLSLVTQSIPPRRPAFIADVLLCTLASRRLDQSGR
jgi:hypothetical protein